MDERTQALLESSDPDERLQGLRLVTLYEDADAVRAVERILFADEEPEGREHAVRALGVTRGAGALDALLRAARSDEDAMVRRTALVVLGETGERAVARQLASLLDSLDAHDQATAIDALRACGSPEPLPAIAELARVESAHVRALVLHAWASLAPDPRAASAELALVAAEVAEKGPLWALGAAALVRGADAAALIDRDLLHAARHERDSAVYRVLDLPAPVAVACLRAIVARAEQSEDRELGLAAARELAKRGDASGARVLARVLHDPEARGRIGAAASLAELGAAMGEPLLLRTLASPSAPERAPVARALALCGRPEGVRALGALLSSDLPADRRFAAIGFADMGRADGAAELVRSLDYPLKTERLEALAALRALWPEGPALDPLMSAVERAPVIARYGAHFTR